MPTRSEIEVKVYTTHEHLDTCSIHDTYIWTWGCKPGNTAERTRAFSGNMQACLREGEFSAECEAGLAALNDVDDADEAGGLTGSFASKILDLCCDGVEITLPFFRDLLADKPVDSADAIRSLSEWSAGVAVGGEKGKKGGKNGGKMAWDGEADKFEFKTLRL
ncbi:hypothetical protein B0H11DRAFT_1933023 [Mycena galericulata]|nr:hypothetical protein B0H11DRAFT_1933023 [Mycena galericulata]